MWRKGDPLTLLVGMQTSTALWRTVWRFIKKLEIELPYDPAVPLLGIYPERKPKLKKTHVPQCSLQQYLQQLGHGSNLDVHWQMNGKGSCGMYTQWDIIRL